MIDNKEIKDSNTIMLLQYVRLNSLIQKKTCRDWQVSLP
jgi:hypothetical protein